jgi:hypothetical protein
MTAEYLLSLLVALERRIPPPPNCHHAITRTPYGSDEHGWQDQLGLHVWVGGKMQTFFMGDDGNDLDRPVDVVVEEIAAHVDRRQGGESK